MRLVATFLVSGMPGVALASDMAGVGLAISVPVTALLFVSALVVSVMSVSRGASLYVSAAAITAAVIGLVMAGTEWRLEDDKALYQTHFVLTVLCLLPPVIQKLRAKAAEGHNKAKQAGTP